MEGCNMMKVLVVMMVLSSTFVALTNTIRNTLMDSLSLKEWCPNLIIVFGDSLSDTGNLYLSDPLNPTFKISEPYGMTYFKHPANRYSDGRLVVDFLMEALGYPFLNPIQLENVTGTNYKHGVNFAYSGSTARNDSTTTPYHLKKQVEQFLNFKNKNQFEHSLKKKNTKQQQPHEVIELQPSIEDYKNGLYIIQVGGNDLFYGYLQGSPPTKVIENIVPQSVNSIISTIEELYNNGARRFIVLNIPAQGCSPIILSTMGLVGSQKDNYGCLKEFNDVAQVFNIELRVGIEHLQQELEGAKIMYGDNYNLNYNVIRDPTSHGFLKETKLQASCGVGGPYNFNPTVTCSHSGEVQGVGIVNLKEAPNDPTQYIYWDGIHFTEAYNKIVSETLLNGEYLTPSISLKNLCHVNL